MWFDDDTLLATAEDRGETHLYRLAADGSSPPERITSGPHTIHSFDAAGGRIAMAQATVERPAEIVTLDGSVTSVTRSLGWERFSVPTTDGTDEIDAWIMRPEGLNPDASTRAAQRARRAVHAVRRDVLRRGPTAGRRRVRRRDEQPGAVAAETAWGQAIRPKHPTVPGTGWGSVDLDDVLSVIDATLDRYRFCDRDRAGMLGGSYGGYMATLLAARHDGRFRPSAASEPSTTCCRRVEQRTSRRRSIEHGPSHLDDPDEYMVVADRTRARHRRADAAHPLRGRPALPDHAG